MHQSRAYDLVVKQMDISDILSFIGDSNCKVVGKEIPKVERFKPISSANKGDITFCGYKGEKGVKLVSASNASVIICHHSLIQVLDKPDSVLIFVENPRLAFIRCLSQFTKASKSSGIHPSSVIESKQIGKNLVAGPLCYISENVKIGNNVTIHGGVHIYGNTIIGNDVIIRSSTVIGSEGFGYEKNECGEWEHFPHIGGVVIEDRVEIGANVCIDRGTLANTVVGAGTKIDNLVHIAHNVQIGKNCVIVAQTFVGGSSVIEDQVYIAMSVSIRDGVRIGRNAMVGMGAVVTKDVLAGTVVIGVPARQFDKK